MSGPLSFPRAKTIATLAWGASIGAAAGSMARFGLSTDSAVAVGAMNARIEIVKAGRLSLLRVERLVTPGAGTTVTYTVRVNGVNTAVTCTMGNGPTTAQDLVNSVAVNPGDFVELTVSITGAPGSQPTIVSLGYAA